MYRDSGLYSEWMIVKYEEEGILWKFKFIYCEIKLSRDRVS